MNDALHSLAAKAGVETSWQDAFGVHHDVPDSTLRAVLTALGLPSDSASQCSGSLALLASEEQQIPPLVTADVSSAVEIPGTVGRFRIIGSSGEIIDGSAEPSGSGRVRLVPVKLAGDYILEFNNHEYNLAVAPMQAFTVTDAMMRLGINRVQRPWGLAAQAYAIRQRNDDIMGDFVALSQLAESAARQGAHALAISPLHALFAAEPRHYSPYAPSSRIALNPVYVAELSLRGSTSPTDLIDWSSANKRRMTALRNAFIRDEQDPNFIAFEKAASKPIKQHAVFEALSAFQVACGGTIDWRDWPIPWHSPYSDTIESVSSELGSEIRFHLYAQFRAAQALAAVQNGARTAGMAIGLITDLAVGADPAGSDAWSQQEAMLRGLTIGAPPDALSREGQAWGLTAFSPRGSQHTGYEGFRAMLRAAMEHAGGVRVDHAMGWRRLWVIPDGASSSEGCYLQYPFNDLLRLAVLESHRNQAILVAEDLGTVPPGFREELAERGILGMSVMWFERDGTRFAPPANWRRATTATTTTHDLPTTAGWWRGADIEWRKRLGLAGDSCEQRQQDRASLWAACTLSGSASGSMPLPDENDAIADAIASHLGSTRAELAVLPIEDALALINQANIPGTTDQHPNWRRMVPGVAESMLEESHVKDRIKTLNMRRNSLEE